MIKLYLNGQPVALYTDTKIGITAMNPYFNEIGACSYPFTIPYKPNEQVLLHAARIQSTTLAKNFVWDAILEVDGIQVLIGEAVAEGDFAVREGQFPIVLRSAKTSFAKQAELKKMQEVEFGGETYSGETEPTSRTRRTYTLNACYPELAYVCAPVYNAADVGDVAAFWHVPKYINQYDASLWAIAAPTSENKTAFITYNFYVRWILKKLIETSGFALMDDDMATIADLNRWFLCSFNYLDRYFPEYRYSFPQITVRDFLKAIRQFGIVVVIDERRRTGSIRFVKSLFGATTINQLLNANPYLDTVVLSYPKEGYAVAYKEGYGDRATQEVGPNMTVVTVANIAALPSPTEFYASGTAYYTSGSGKYYQCVIAEKAVDTNPDVWIWKEVSQCRAYTMGNGEEKVEIGVKVAGQRWETQAVTRTVAILGEDGETWNYVTKTWNIDVEMPDIDQKMNATFQSGATGKYEDWPLVFLFNWGLKTYVCSEDSHFTTIFPQISGDCYSRDETLLGSISMRTEGTKSIVAQLVKAEQDWLLVRKSKRQYFRLSVLDYANFEWGDTYNVANVNYLVNSLKFDITVQGISLIEAELYTV